MIFRGSKNRPGVRPRAELNEGEFYARGANVKAPSAARKLLRTGGQAFIAAAIAVCGARPALEAKSSSKAFSKRRGLLPKAGRDPRFINAAANLHRAFRASHHAGGSAGGDQLGCQATVNLE